MSRRRTDGGGGRPRKVGESIRQAISALLQEGALKDPRIRRASLLTVTGVDVSPDLRNARAFVSVYPDEPRVVAEVIAGLSAAANEVRRALGARLSLRYTPELSFAADGSIAYGAHVEAVLREVAAGGEDAGDHAAEVVGGEDGRAHAVETASGEGRGGEAERAHAVETGQRSVLVNHEAGARSEPDDGAS